MDVSCSHAPRNPCIELGRKSKDEELCRTKYSIHTHILPVRCSIQYGTDSRHSGFVVLWYTTLDLTRLVSQELQDQQVSQDDTR